ncbi:hypothetical protein B0H10DRAFT_1966968 [Mycena sp. CBHHK59/15]|nr:hypothetical protein B0H10DRAFT_1966968 [Mycena sp. CBHHK59/15]
MLLPSFSPTKSVHTKNILKKHRFDLPPGIENNPVDFGKLSGSLKANKADKKISPGPEHQNIFKLIQIFVDSTQCTVTIELCAPIAFMTLGPNSETNSMLASPPFERKQKAMAFRHILTKDQEQHSVKDYEISDASVDNFQQEVDDLINAGATDLATSVAQPQAENLIFVAFISPTNIFVFYLSILRPAISTTETSPMKPAGTHPNQLGCHQLDLDP